jgi:hypothetical protein
MTFVLLFLEVENLPELLPLVGSQLQAQKGLTV